MSNEQTLPLILKQLKLTVINRHWEEYSEIAIDKDWSHSKYLGVLAELELALFPNPLYHLFVQI